MEVDLAETGEMSTVNHWRMWLQRQMDDYAAAFRPLVRGATTARNTPQGRDLAAFQPPA